MKKLFQHMGAAFGAEDHERAGASDFPSHPGRVWVEQDLWRQAAASPAGRSAPVAQRPQPAAKAFDFTETDIVRAPVRPADARRTAGPQVYTQRNRDAHSDRITRFMEINRTVQGGRGFAYRVIQKMRGVSADYDLWKGPTRQVTFLLG